ncbi:MAG TPA: hypothetical protein VMI31_00740, partial [Fimbriimonadaceae bacterium]|nr:hypothetical protein [Fimbriimonadaceae bacterium]
MLSLLAASTMIQMPVYDPKPVLGDWLLNQVPSRAAVYKTGDPGKIVLSNGLVGRTFRLREGSGATVGLDNLMTGEGMLRAVRPEATLSLDGRIVTVGGLEG